MKFLFYTLEIVKPASIGIAGLFFHILHKLQKKQVPDPTVETREFSGIRYGHIRALEISPQQPDWHGIRDLLDNKDAPILTPDNVNIPPHTQLTQLTLTKCELHMLAATACEIVKRTRMPMYRRSIGVIDSSGDFIPYLPQLLNHYTSIQVFTKNTSAYKQTSAQMMKQFGAPVAVLDSILDFSDCVLILAIGSEIESPTGKLPTLSCPLLATNSFKPSFSCDLFSGLELPQNLDIAEAAPSGIAPHRFAAALYECADIPSPLGFAAGNMLHNGSPSSLPEAVRQVMISSGVLSLF